MSYTLVSASVLGYELCRLPAGADVARTLLTGLSADATTLRQLAAAVTSVRGRSHGCPATPAVDELRSIVDRMDSTSTGGELAQLLRTSRFDGPAALDRLIRQEILGPGSSADDLPEQTREQAADLLSSFAVAAWLLDETETATTSSTLRAVPSPVLNVQEPENVMSPDLGPNAAELRGVLGSLGGADAVRRRAREAIPPEHFGPWTVAMHEACWAAHLTGRVRTTATAQLLGVLAFREAGFGPDEVASGVWSAFSGVLQATAVADVLAQDAFDILRAPSAGVERAA